MGHPARILIYGAYGTTGRQAARWLAEHHPTRRSDFVLAGRRAEPLRAVAERRGFAHRAFALDDPKQVAAHLSDIDTVLLLAGPFVQTGFR